MTPEECAIGRQVRTIEFNAIDEVLFYEGGDAVLRMKNDRGTIEVLAISDRASDFVAAATAGAPLDLTGFFRRRSGFHADGTRHFIWCLVLLSWSEAGQSKLAA